MLFNLSHYQEPCCIRYRPDIKAIMRNGWSICYHLRYPDADPPPRLPVLVYQSPSNDEFKIPGTLHLPAVCELDLTALRPPLSSELGNTVVLIYGCIPPYHYILLRDPDAATILEPYLRQIVKAINRRLSKELKAYYQKNDKAKCWLEQQRRHKNLGQRQMPILTFGYQICCLKFRIEYAVRNQIRLTCVT